MKKLLFLLCFLSTSAFAIDKPIPCSGNSCKLLFETTSAGGAKVSAGNVDGLGKWTIGPAAYTGTHEVRGSFSMTSGSSLSAGVALFNNVTTAVIALTNGSSSVFTTSGKATFVIISNTTNSDTAFYITGGTSTSLGTISGGSWFAVDSGTGTRFFKTASTTHELKNATGSTVSYRMTWIILDQ